CAGLCGAAPAFARRGAGALPGRHGQPAQASVGAWRAAPVGHLLPGRVPSVYREGCVDAAPVPGGLLARTLGIPGRPWGREGEVLERLDGLLRAVYRSTFFQQFADVTGPFCLRIFYDIVKDPLITLDAWRRWRGDSPGSAGPSFPDKETAHVPWSCHRRALQRHERRAHLLRRIADTGPYHMTLDVFGKMTSRILLLTLSACA